MTGKDLLQILQSMDIAELNYTILIGLEERWVQLATVTKDFNMKSIDLQGEKS